MNEVFWGKGSGKKKEENGYLGEVSGGDEGGDLFGKLDFVWGENEEKLEEGDNSRTRISVNE